MMKWLAVWRQFWQEAWCGSTCRKLLLGSFFARWLIPMEADEAAPSGFVGSFLYRLTNPLLAMLLRLMWQLGAMMRSLIGGSMILGFCRRVWHATLLDKGLSWWRSN